MENGCEAVFTIDPDFLLRVRAAAGPARWSATPSSSRCYGDLIHDCHGLPVDADFFGTFPTGDGVRGGVLRSWFFVTDGKEAGVMTTHPHPTDDPQAASGCAGMRRSRHVRARPTAAVCGCEPTETCALECLERPLFTAGMVLSDSDLTALVDWTGDRLGLQRLPRTDGASCAVSTSAATPTPRAGSSSSPATPSGAAARTSSCASRRRST